MSPPSAAGTGYVLLHHVMGVAGGARGVWGYVEGGMGALSDALRRGADAAGVTVRVDAPVAQIETAGGRAVAVRLVSGERITARQIVSNATPAVTRSEEHTSELQSLMLISYAVFCLNKKKIKIKQYQLNKVTN